MRTDIEDLIYTCLYRWYSKDDSFHRPQDHALDGLRYYNIHISKGVSVDEMLIRMEEEFYGINKIVTEYKFEQKLKRLLG